MSSADWVFDENELAALFNEKTKAIILNTPNNPLGKVFSRDELTIIANLCKQYNVLCISDEVYEWMIFDDDEHVRICESIFRAVFIFGSFDIIGSFDNRHIAGHVGTHNHHWIGGQNIFGDRMEDWLGLRTIEFTLQFANGASELIVYVRHTNPSMSSHCISPHSDRTLKGLICINILYFH